MFPLKHDFKLRYAKKALQRTPLMKLTLGCSLALTLLHIVFVVFFVSRRNLYRFYLLFTNTVPNLTKFSVRTPKVLTKLCKSTGAFAVCLAYSPFSCVSLLIYNSKLYEKTVGSVSCELHIGYSDLKLGYLG